MREDAHAKRGMLLERGGRSRDDIATLTRSASSLKVAWRNVNLCSAISCYRT